MSEQQQRLPMRAKLRRLFCTATGIHCRTEIQGNQGLFIQGCCGIEAFTPTCILLQVRDPHVRILCVVGEGLLCSSYHEEGVQITGNILRVEFCNQKLKEEGNES